MGGSGDVRGLLRASRSHLEAPTGGPRSSSPDLGKPRRRLERLVYLFDSCQCSQDYKLMKGALKFEILGGSPWTDPLNPTRGVNGYVVELPAGDDEQQGKEFWDFTEQLIKD